MSEPMRAIITAVVGLVISLTGIVTYFVGYHFGWRDARGTAPEHRCPYCGETLRAVTVQDVEDPLPAGAQWVCPECDPISYFADLPTSAKPVPSEEL